MIKLLIDSGGSLSLDILKDVLILNTEINIDDDCYVSSMNWKCFTPEFLIKCLNEDKIIRTTQSPIGVWIRDLMSIFSDWPDYDFLYLATSSNLGGSVRVFNIIKNLMKTDRNIDMVEVNGAGPVVELAVLEALDGIKDGLSVSEIKSKINNLNRNVRFYAISESMKQWSHTGRSNDKKVNDSYPKGLPLMKGLSDGHIGLSCLNRSFDDALNNFKKDINDLKATRCVVNYIHGTYTDWIDRFKKTVEESLDCKASAVNEHGPTVTCIEGVNSVDVAFI